MIEKVVGISFRKTSDPAVVQGAEITLLHDKANEYSARAIGVEINGNIVGYIGEANNENHEKIWEHLPLKGAVAAVARLKEGESFQSFKVGEVTHLEVEFPMPCDSDGKMKSFNENIELVFNPDTHRYLYGGRELTSATRYIKKWIEPFDKETVARMCANSYGCDVQTVLDYWSGAGKVAATYGTAIHDALDHYEKFKQLGQLLQERKNAPHNKALPTHPSIRAIVEDFYKLPLHEGVVHTEVLVTNVERGFCGLVDRLLVTGSGKTCRVQDYKINIDADVEDKNTKFLGQFADLPKNKLSKYQLQLSFYARLLELAGWTVQGLDVFVYEDHWRHFPMQVLKLDF